MCKRAVLTILALEHLLGEEVAELGFIFVLVVESLYPVVRALALVSLRALLSLGELAQLRGVRVVIPSLVLDGVEVKAGLVIVRLVFPWALNPLKVHEVQMLDLHLLTGPMVLFKIGEEDLDVLVIALGRG